MHKIKKNGVAKSKKRKLKNINSHGYDISKFAVLDIPVRRDPETGRFISTNH